MNKGESSHHSAQDIRVNMAKLSWMAYQTPEHCCNHYSSAWCVVHI